MKADHGNAFPVRRWLAAAALAVLSLIATGAQAKGSIDKYTDLFWTQSGNTASGTLGQGAAQVPKTATTTPGGASISANKPLPWPGKAQAQAMAKWKMLAKPNNIAKSILSPQAAIAIAVGGGLAYALEQACVRLAGGQMQLAEGAQWEECKTGGGGSVVYRYKVGTYLGPAHSTPQDVCNVAELDAYNSGPGIVGTGWIAAPVQAEPPPYYSAGKCWFYYKAQYSSGGFGPLQQTSFTVISEEGAPAGGEWGTASEATVEAALTETLNGMCAAGDAKCAAVVQELIDNGGHVQTDEEQLQPQLEGPAESEGETTTTTQQKADGRTVTITTVTTNNYTYEGNKVTTTTTTVTTTTTQNPDGTTTTETETTEEEAEPEPQDECAENPDRVTCQELGDVPDEEVPKANKTVEFQTEDMGWGGGSCPAPYTWHDSLGNHSIDLAPFCAKVVEVVRPVVLLLAALAALAIALPAIKE